MSQIKTFFLRVGDVAAEEEANAFLRGHRVVRVDRAWGGDGWSVLVEWLEGTGEDGGGAGYGGRWKERKVDFRPVCSAAPSLHPMDSPRGGPAPLRLHPGPAHGGRHRGPRGRDEHRRLH